MTRSGSDGSRATPHVESEPDEELVQLCLEAVLTSAHDLDLDPHAFALELAQGEVGLLISYLAAAAPHVPDLEQRARIHSLLHRLTGWTGRDAAGAHDPESG